MAAVPIAMTTGAPISSKINKVAITVIKATLMILLPLLSFQKTKQ